MGRRIRADRAQQVRESRAVCVYPHALVDFHHPNGVEWHRNIVWNDYVKLYKQQGWTAFRLFSILEPWMVGDDGFTVSHPHGTRIWLDLVDRLMGDMETAGCEYLFASCFQGHQGSVRSGSWTGPPTQEETRYAETWAEICAAHSGRSMLVIPEVGNELPRGAFSRFHPAIVKAFNRAAPTLPVAANVWEPDFGGSLPIKPPGVDLFAALERDWSGWDYADTDHLGVRGHNWGRTLPRLIKSRASGPILVISFLDPGHGNAALPNSSRGDVDAPMAFKMLSEYQSLGEDTPGEGGTPSDPPTRVPSLGAVWNRVQHHGARLNKHRVRIDAELDIIQDLAGQVALLQDQVIQLQSDMAGMDDRFESFRARIKNSL